MSVLRHVFEWLRQEGLVRSEREFSRKWMGRAPNYACESRLEKCSASTGMQLAQRLIHAKQEELAAMLIAAMVAAASRG